MAPRTGDASNGADRRVEIFVFDDGIDPAPSNSTSEPTSAEYGQWRTRVVETIDVSADAVQHEVLEVRLHDAEQRPLPNASFRLRAGNEILEGHADDEGFLSVVLDACPERVHLEWGATDGAGAYEFARELVPECTQGSDESIARARLHNLGYSVELSFERSVRAFQIDYQVDHLPEPSGLIAGELPPATRARLDDIFTNLNCDASPS